MTSPVPTHSIESRWPVALTILVVLVLLTVLPDRIRVFPVWLPYLLGLVILVAIALVPLTGGKRRALRTERWITLLFCLLVGAGMLVGLRHLIFEMFDSSGDLDGLELFTSSVAVWMIGILIFALVYWQSDRGGPEMRLSDRRRSPDWLFPQADLDDILPHWQPTFVDYLFLAYTTATAFSPTDVAPISTWAKLMLMAQSLISLATILVVVSRAINILGS
ncbi:hypothetical protein VB780_07440 [Leptolyngbya sp. CCNP1308]|uniref:hypothetical protein n=1 Tax=Leptolyngbya sp. CCNP1308 TaxID=3110255 RepID=UPI002B214363|nr:hypothetical protein [Leptolyngbya sp. CCNP1308]MEA5448394.1 hypothetical protein [Leptolyngbya sp. CCNP1308]